MSNLTREGPGATLRLKTSRLLGVVLALGALPSALSVAVVIASASAYEGFGAVTRGADDCPTGFTTYHVTSLADAGAGTLRDAVSVGCRHIVFDVAGTITLAANLKPRVSYLTIDGSTAPSPGITINHPTINEAVSIEPNAASGPVHDIIVRYLRHTGPAGHNDTAQDVWGLDGTVAAVYNIILDHITCDGPNDGCFDIFANVHDVTVSWNLTINTVTVHSVAGGGGQKLNISVHHNVYAKGNERQPKYRGDTTADHVNNVVYGWGWVSAAGRGIQIDSTDAVDPSVNLVKNYFHRVATTPDPAPDGAFEYQNGVGGSKTYFDGNIFPATETTTTGTDGSRVVTIPGYAEVTTYAANTLGDNVVRCVGTHYRTAAEQSLLDEISLAIGGSGGSCPANPVPAPPTNLVVQ